MDPVAEKQAAVWASIDELCSSLEPSEWDLSTECPGWTVKDQLSHLLAPEIGLLGHPQPDHHAPEAAHVKNPVGALNEDAVDYRRSRPGDEILDEFRRVTGERVRVLSAMSEADLAADSWTPVGPGSVRDLLTIRFFDAWTHEQDMRRATNRPGSLEGSLAEHSRDRCLLAMPFVVGKKAKAPEGSVVVFDITGPSGKAVAIGVEGGRAKALDTLPRDSTCVLRMDVEAFTRLSCGRWDPTAAISRGQVQVEGDHD